MVKNDIFFLCVLISSHVYVMMDLSGMDSVKVDQRGHRWLQTSMTKDEQEWLDEVRKDWVSAADEAIEQAKNKITGLFGGEELCGHNFRGQACRDFIYVFSTDGVSHYFVSTGANTNPIAIKCEGECDMSFSPDAEFDLVVMQRDLGM